MNRHFIHKDCRVLLVRLPDTEAEDLCVPAGAHLIIRMDVHPRKSCVIVGGVAESIFERLDVSKESPAYEPLRRWLSHMTLSVQDTMRAQFVEVIRTQLESDAASGVPLEGTISMLSYWVCGLLTYQTTLVDSE